MRLRRLALCDRAEIEAITAHHLPYSDYDFASLWSWDVKEEICWGAHRGALVVQFTDYVTGEPFLGFMGGDDPVAIAADCLALAATLGLCAELRLIPEETARSLGSSFRIAEMPEHHDYTYELDRFIAFTGKELKHRRNQLNRFRRCYPAAVVDDLDLSCGSVQTEIMQLWERWRESRDAGEPDDLPAFLRLTSTGLCLETLGTGIRVQGRLIAANVSTLSPQSWATGLFEKADIQYEGAYAALTHATASRLIAVGVSHYNHEQDLGVAGLRQAKRALSPSRYLRKFSISKL